MPLALGAAAAGAADVMSKFLPGALPAWVAMASARRPALVASPSQSC